MSHNISLVFALLGVASAFQLIFSPTTQAWGAFEGEVINTLLIVFSVLLSFLSLSLNTFKNKVLPTVRVVILLNFIATFILLSSIDWKSLFHF